MHRPRLAFISLSLATLLLIGSCMLTPRPAAGDPSIRGVVTSAAPGADGEVTILIEAEGAPAFEFDKASVRVTRDTRVFRETGSDSYARGSAAEITEGATVDAWFEGPVAESYPVQASAGTVVIRE